MLGQPLLVLLLLLSLAQCPLVGVLRSIQSCEKKMLILPLLSVGRGASLVTVVLLLLLLLFLVPVGGGGGVNVVKMVLLV